MAYQTVPAAPAPGSIGSGTVEPGDMTGFTEKRIPFGASTTALEDVADLTYDKTTHDLSLSVAESGGTVGSTTANSSNTASSDARKVVQSGGTSAGDAYYSAGISGGQTYVWGVDNSVSGDPFVFSVGSALGTADALSVNSNGQIGFGIAPQFTYAMYARASASQEPAFLLDSASTSVTTQMGVATGSGSSRVCWLKNYGSAAAGSTFGETNADMSSLEAYGSDRLMIGISGTNSIVFNTDSVRRMAISGAGEVGIGGAPVAGFLTSFLSSSDVALKIETSTGSGAAGTGLSINTGSARSAKYLSYGTSSSGNTFYGEAKSDLAAIELTNLSKFAFAINNVMQGIFLATGFAVTPTGAERAFVGGVIETLQSDVGNVGTGEDTLHTYTLPASMLNTNGQAVQIEAVFTFAANGNAKRVKLHFGATVVYDSGSVAENGGSVTVRATVVRTAATTQRALATVVGGTLVADDSQYSTPGETLSGTVVIKSTGEATDNDDIVARITRINWSPAN